MKQILKTRTTLHITLPHPSPADLRGRQSVRATFKLSRQAIDLISVVATHLGIKQKSLFDHLIEDVETLKLLAEDIPADPFGDWPRIQKTYVLSRGALASLEKVSSEYEVPRDAVVELSVQRLVPVLRAEQEKHSKRQALFREVMKHQRAGEDLLQKAREVLGNEDPLCDLLADAVGVGYDCQRRIAELIEQGTAIEGF
jgi:hypothetical protein